MKSKNTKDMQFIKKFKQINIKNISKKLKYPMTNVSNGRLKDEKILKVKNEIIYEFCKLVCEDIEGSNNGE